MKHKNIPKGQGLFEYFNQKTLRIVKNTNIPFFIYSEKNQLGNTFAERFTNAVEQLFAQGYSKVIALGNDCPNLKTAHILTAVEKLSKSNMVLGPSTDGGIYLLGLHKIAFDKKLLLKLPWQTKSLYKSFTTYNHKLGNVVDYLNRLTDIDSLHDVKDFLASEKSLPIRLKQLLLFILKTLTTKIEFAKVFISSNKKASPFNKGSPHVVYAFA